MDKILIIGQAPPAVEQGVPYDTTMLYDWLNEIGISKEDAQEMFEFDAVYDQFPGFSESGGHLAPTFVQMEDYYNRHLRDKISKYSKIILLGGVAKSYLTYKKGIQRNHSREVLCLIHPSKRNWNLYLSQKDSLLKSLKEFIIMINN